MAQPFQRLGLIGDVHGEDEYLTVAIKHLQQLGAEELLCVGDLADGRGDLNRVCELLVADNVLTVRGNHDRWLLNNEARYLPEAVQLKDVHGATWDYLKTLKTSLMLETVAGNLMLCHGMGDNDMGQLTPGDYGYGLANNLGLYKVWLQADISFVVAGHTHKPMVRRFARPAGNALTVINVGQLKHSSGPTFVWADFTVGELQFFDIEIDNVVNAGRQFCFADVPLESIS